MSTVIRTELSEKNKYYIPKERYLELRHFVNQYDDWGSELISIDLYRHSNACRERVTETKSTSFLEDLVIKRTELYSKKYMVDQAFKMSLFGERPVNDLFKEDFKRTVIKGLSYDKSAMTNYISRTRYYELYRKFFYELDKIRD